MSETTLFTIGADVSCTDGICGEMSRVVVDPLARAVTHLVVAPKHQEPRLVPLALVDTTTTTSTAAATTATGDTTGEIRLRCTKAEFGKLDPAEETEFLPGTSGYGYGTAQVLSWPYYGMAGGLGIDGGLGGAGVPLTVTRDKIPLGEVAVRRGQQVHATDGEIGKVQGLVIDPRDHHVTHVLLQEGHLWGRKEVAIPIGAVTGVDDGIRLSITKEQVQDLPPVDIDHPND